MAIVAVVSDVVGNHRGRVVEPGLGGVIEGVGDVVYVACLSVPGAAAGADDDAEFEFRRRRRCGPAMDPSAHQHPVCPRWRCGMRRAVSSVSVLPIGPVST